MDVCGVKTNVEKGTKRSRAPKTDFFVPEGILGNRGYFGYFFFVFGYPRVFWVPLGGDDGDSPVVLHAAALNHKVAGSNPTPRGGEINHKSGRSIINQ